MQAGLVKAVGAVGAVAAMAMTAGPVLAAGSPVPKLTSPHAGARIAVGHVPTFTAVDPGVHSEVSIELSKKKLNRHQKGLPPAPSLGGFQGSMRAVKGHPGRFTYAPSNYKFSGSWIETPGTYYVQVSHSAPGENFYSTVTTIHVH